MSQTFNRLKLYFSHNKMLLLAIIVSLALHAALVTKFSLTLPAQLDNQQTLTMRLVKLQPVQKSAPAPIKEKIPKPEAPPTASTKPIAAQPTMEPTMASSDDIDTSVDTSIAQAEDSSTQDIEQVTAMPTGVEALDTTNPNPNMTETISPTEPDNVAQQPRQQVYKYVETQFEVRRGGDATAAGTATIVFTTQDNATYRLTSTTEAKGLAALIFGTLEQVSEGAITEYGLRPSYYSYQYGANADKKQYANFAWSDGVIEMHSNKGKKTEKLPDGTQDLLSFMYQFMFTPPLETMQISITNGKNLRTYTYSFEGEETIATELGDLKTLHLLKSGEKQEKTEVWLALDYQNIPVKIRKTEKDGGVIEQTVTTISTTRPE
ncbi:MAG: DUF3108 domain-containing protein [Methylotenera sp.]|nr:DUF3108 domain-containing protein [Methylotenera sp.]